VSQQNQESKKNRAMAQALTQMARAMGMNLSAPDLERFKRTLLEMLIRCDRVSTPEALDYIDEIFRPLDAVEEALGDAKPADKKVPKLRAASKKTRALNGHPRRTHGRSNEHWHNGANAAHATDGFPDML